MTKRNEEKVFHTTVLHVHPDLEALASLKLLADGYVDGLALEKDFELKFIPSGELRIEDWRQEATVDARLLERRGYLFVDCGGERTMLDHHGRGDDDNRCTLERLELHEGEGFEFLRGFISIIAAQDKKGKAIDRDKKYKASSSPNTPRTLRSLISGWNLLYSPEQVVWLAFRALDGVFCLIQQAADRSDEKSPPVANRGYFTVDQIIAGLRLFNVGDDEVGHFQEYCRLALERMEAEWQQAEVDFREAKIEALKGPVVYQDGRRRRETNIMFVYGTSRSIRFGSYARLQAGAEAKRREFEEAEVIVLQQWDDSHCVVSSGCWTQKFELDRPRLVLSQVVAALRAADIGFRGGRIHQPEQLGQPGDVWYHHQGRRVKSPFFMPEFRTVCGNRFFTNPGMEATVIRPDMVVAIIRQTLQGQTPECPRGGCSRRCRWHQFRLVACQMENPKAFQSELSCDRRDGQSSGNGRRGGDPSSRTPRVPREEPVVEVMRRPSRRLPSRLK